MSASGNFATIAAAPSGTFQPVLEITLRDTPPGDYPGADPSWLFLSSGIVFARGVPYWPLVTEWGDISRGFDAFASGFQPLEVAVTLADGDDTVKRALESGQQRGSTAVIYYALPNNATDYQVLFTGILERWGYRSGHVVELTLRTDDAILRRYVP